jgi:Trypsin-co-occurring domain 1
MHSVGIRWGIMERTEIVEVRMPDSTVINAEVVVADSITDVAARQQLNLGEAKDSIASFVRWAVGGLGVSAEDSASVPEPESSPSGMVLSRVGLEFGLKLAIKSGMLTSVIAAVGGEASAVVRLEWEQRQAGR